MKRTDGKYPEIIRMMTNKGKYRKKISSIDYCTMQEMTQLQNGILKHGLDFAKLCLELPAQTKTQIYARLKKLKQNKYELLPGVLEKLQKARTSMHWTHFQQKELI